MNSKIIISSLVSGQIFLIILSFLLISYVDNEYENFEKTIDVVIETRQLSDALMFETQRYLAGVPYANPHDILDEIDDYLKIIRDGGIADEVHIEPLPSKYQDTLNVVKNNFNLYTNHVQNIIGQGSFRMDYSNSEFVLLETEKFDANGSIDFFIQELRKDKEEHNQNFTFLQISLAIFNVGIHVFMIIIILDILSRNTKKMVKLERFSSIGELAARLAHDIRNPLTVIKITTDLLQREEITEEQKIKLKRVDNAIFRISHQINNVLDQIRNKTLNKENISLKDALNSAFSDAEISEDIVISYPKNDVNIMADKEAITTTFTNIIINAIQAIKSKGKIEARIIDQEKSVKVEIEDSGPGILNENLSNIFEPLFTTKQTGTGLGLSSCKNIIEQHGGTISVKNNPTTFTINLPK